MANFRMKFSVKYPRRTRPFKSGVCTCTENPDPIPRKKHRSAIRRSDPRLSKVALAFLMVAWRKRALGRDVQETKMKISEKWYIFCQKRWLLVFSGMELSVSPRQWTSKDAHWFWEISYPFFISLLTQEEEERLFLGNSIKTVLPNSEVTPTLIDLSHRPTTAIFSWGLNHTQQQRKCTKLSKHNSHGSV